MTAPRASDAEAAVEPGHSTRWTVVPVALRGAIARSWSATAVWCLALLWGAFFAVWAARRHEAFLSHRFDLGNMVQAVWSTAHGRFLEATTGDGTQMSRLGVHVDPLLAAFAPAWWVWPSPLLLTTVQAFALASGVLPVYWLARKHAVDERVAFNLSLAYLLYPAVQLSALNDFHPVTLAVPLLLFMVWALDDDRLVLACLFAVLAALSKEDVPLVVAGIGIWFAIRHRRPFVGGAIAAFGVSVMLVDLYAVVPHFAGGPSVFYDRLASVGGSPSGVARTLFTDPERIWSAVTTGADVRYLVVLLVPLVALWMFEPLLVLAAAPVLALNLLSDFGPMTSVRYQYVSAIVPCLFAAAAIGVGRLDGRWALIATSAVLGLVALFALTGPIPDLDTYGASTKPSDAKVAALRRAVALVPPGVPVSASNDLGAHLSDRARVFSFPLRKEADWVAVNASEWRGEANPVGETMSPRLYAEAVRALRADPTFELVFSQTGVYVYRRR